MDIFLAGFECTSISSLNNRRKDNLQCVARQEPCPPVLQGCLPGRYRCRSCRVGFQVPLQLPLHAATLAESWAALQEGATGQTFGWCLGVLEKARPSVAVFENVCLIGRTGNSGGTPSGTASTATQAIVPVRLV